MKKITLIVIIGLFLIPLAWAYDGSTEGQPPYDPDLPPCILIPAYCENVQPNPIDALSQSSYYWAWNTTRTDIPNGVQTNKTYYIIEKKAGTPTELLQIEASSWYTGDYKEENSNCWEGLSLFGYQKHHETVSFNLFTIRTIGSQVKFLYKATKNVTECWKNPWDIYPTINTYSEVFEGERFVRSANCKDTGCPTNQYCDTVSGNCVKCLDNTHCSAPTPACNQSTQTCVECTTDAHCFIGVCDASTFSCVCPPECDIDPSTVACGQQLVPQSCLQHEPVCDWPDPLIGWKCNDIDERCANHENQNKCWSPNEIDCGTEVVPYIPNPDTMMGLYCDDFQNESHKLCDTSLSTPACLPVLKKTEYPLKYLFNVSVDPEWALWYNIWFKFRFDTADEFPQILQHDTDHPEQTGLYCFGCSVQPDSVSAFSLFQEPTAEEDKEGLIRFYIGNNNLFGPLNYARIKLQDKIDPTKGDSETEKTDFAILKLNAGYSGHCVSEDRTIRGETGIAIAPKVKYDWSWGNQGYKLDFCSPDHPVPTYCDSTQFAIALFDRLEEMRELYALGQEDEATALKDFEVLLMQDGFSEDFLLDFDHYMMNIVGFSTKSWFKDTWTYYLQDTSFLLFNNKTNPSNPLYISEPGHYSVHLQTNWQGSEGFFLEGTQPIATITVNFEEKIADPIPQNPLYFLPIDARIGETVRLGETTPNREGYGTLFDGDSLKLNPNFSTFVSPSNPSAINTSALSEFSETNELSQRGKLFSLNQTSSAIKFAPVTATPVALKTQERNGIAEAYYTLKEAEDDVVIPSGKSASAWTGIGSKNLSSTCHGFHDLPLYFQRGDESPKEGSCAEYHENARGFYWSDVEENQAVFFESVLYRPVSKNIHLITRCENTGAQWVSPNESILSEEAFEPLLLDFTETQGTTVASLQEIVEGVKQGKICQFVSQDNQSLEFFWDRAWLLGALEGDFEHSRYELLSTPNLCS